MAQPGAGSGDLRRQGGVVDDGDGGIADEGGQGFGCDIGIAVDGDLGIAGAAQPLHHLSQRRARIDKNRSHRNSRPNDSKAMLTHQSRQANRASLARG